jgi:hypothetical protein
MIGKPWATTWKQFPTRPFGDCDRHRSGITTAGSSESFPARRYARTEDLPFSVPKSISVAADYNGFYVRTADSSRGDQIVAGHYD